MYQEKSATVWLERNGRRNYKCNRNGRCFDVSFKLKVLEEAKIPHEMVRKKSGGGNCAVIVRMPVLSRPFLIKIAFALKFYSPSFSIRCFPAPETYCIRGKHSRKYGTYIHINIYTADFH